MQPEVMAGSRCQSHHVEAAPVVADHELAVLHPDPHLGRRRVLADVLEGFLRDPQDRCLLVRCQPPVDAVHRHVDGDLVPRCERLAGLGHGLGQPHVDGRRPQLGDECPDLVQAVAQHVAKERQLGMRRPRRSVDHAVQVLDLEDRAGQHLGGSVMDLLGQPLPLRLLRLDDPQRPGVVRIGGAQAGLVDLAVGAGQVAGHHLELAGRECPAA